MDEKLKKLMASKEKYAKAQIVVVDFVRLVTRESERANAVQDPFQGHAQPGTTDIHWISYTYR
jgi:hypothetical protein